MSYVKVKLDEKAPELVKKFLRQNADMMFEDIHCMLRLPIIEANLNANMSFSTMNCLSNLISGFSALLTPNFDTTGSAGKKFKEIITNYYPWNIQLPSGGTKERAIEDIYSYFRNPLTHSLGLRTKGNYLVVVSKSFLSETDIENLEKSDTPPGPAILYFPIIFNSESIEQININVANFYWGVRQTLTMLSSDEQEMQKFNSNLKRNGYK